MTTAHTERELKLGAWPEFALPDLSGFVDGATAAAPTRRELDAIYYDTPDLSMLRRGVTLRFRRGEPPGNLWTAKLPSDTVANGLARRELNMTGRAGAIPAAFADLTRGWAFGRALRPVARIHTVRSSIPLRDGRGRLVATLDDDAVSVHRGRRVVTRFRELEVELLSGGTPDILARVDARLRAAGAEPVPQVPKLARAFGRAASEPWRLAPPELGSKPAVGAAVRARLAGELARLVDQHALVVLDAESGCAGRARAAVRALLTDIDAFGAFLDADTTASIETELVWLDGELAPVAELDELISRLEVNGDAALAALVERSAVRRLDARTRQARGRAQSRLVRTLRGRRYGKLLGRLASFATDPPPAPGPGRRRLDAARAKLVRQGGRRRRGVGEAAAAAAPGASAMAGLRRSTERLIATLELASLVNGPEPKRSLERVRELADLLDEHETALAAAQRLRRVRRGAEQDVAWAAGVLAGREGARADVCRARFARVWQRSARKSAWNWTD
jgi:inorganic triphosphatase YgiF